MKLEELISVLNIEEQEGFLVYLSSINKRKDAKNNLLFQLLLKDCPSKEIPKKLYGEDNKISDIKTIKKDYIIQVKRGTKKVFLNSDAIYWISADGYYINIYSNQGKFLLRRTLKSMLEHLPNNQFVKIHRSAIININYLLELKQAPNKGLLAQIEGGYSHSVSRTYIKNLKELLRNNSV